MWLSVLRPLIGPMHSLTSSNRLKITTRLLQASEELAKEIKVFVPPKGCHGTPHPHGLKFAVRLLHASEEPVNACYLVPHNSSTRKL